MDDRFKVSGWALTIYGAVALITFLFVYIFGITQISNISSLPTGLFLLINIILVINFLALLCGIYLLKKSIVVHKIALPVSLIIMLSVPFGTLVGAIYLIQRFKEP
jgi:hypothetical protein